MNNNDKCYCPNCNEEVYFNLDSYGRTPIHLHCDNCDINIGANSFKKCKELFEQYHEKHTYIEYFAGEIQLSYIGGKEGKIK